MRILLPTASGRFVSRTLSLTLSVFGFALAAQTAAAAPIDPTNGGLGNGRGCADASCASIIYSDVTSDGAVSGTIDLSGGILDFSISLTGATLSAPGGDGPVSAIDFDLVYAGQAAVTQSGSNYTVNIDQLATIDGTASPIGAGAPATIDANTVLVTGSCSDGGGQLTCGLIFGPQLDFSGDINGNTRFFRHTVNVFAVPEPGTALLLGVGLAGLARTRRRQD